MYAHSSCARNHFVVLLVLLGSIHKAFALGLPRSDRDLYGEPCFYAAISSLEKNTSVDCGADDIKCWCLNTDFTNSVVSCIDYFAPTEELAARAYKSVLYSCNKVIDEDALVNKSNSTETEDYFNIILASEYIKSKEIRNHNYWISHVFGGCLVAYVGLVIVLRTISNFAFKLWPRAWFYLMLNYKSVRFWQRKVILPVTCNIRGINLQLPTRFRLLTLALYFAANIILLAVDYHILLPNYKFISKYDQMAKYLADRCGILAISQLPLLILFAGRNNFMLYCTSWNIDSFNLWHRWIGRVIILELIIHGICHSSVKIMSGRYHIAMQQPFWIWGVAGLIFGGIIAFQSLRIFRNRKYEIFFVLHFILALMFVISAWKHIKHVPVHSKCLYATATIWGTDRLLRVVRITWFYFIASSSSSSKAGGGRLFKGMPKAIARLSGEADYAETIELEVKISPNQKLRYFTGSFAFIHLGLQPYWRWIWQSHPFSVLSQEDEKESENGNNVTTLILFIKRRRDLTDELFQKVHNTVTKNDGKTFLELSILMEGPYGHYQPLDQYNNVLLVAGGIGISTIAAYAHHLQREHVQLTLHDKCRLERIVLIWIVQDLKPLVTISQRLEGLKNVDIHIYVTRDVEPREHVGQQGEQAASSCLNNSNDIPVNEILANENSIENSERTTLKEWENCQNIFANIHLGKPNLTQAIERQIEVAGNRPLAVMTCAPDGVNREVRTTICHSESSNCVDYYEESFSW